MNIDAPSLVDWIAAITLVVAVVALVVSLYTLKAAKEAMVPLTKRDRCRIEERRTTSNRGHARSTEAMHATETLVQSMETLVRAMATLRSIEQLSREANTLNIVVTSLASIPRIPERLNIHPKSTAAYDGALDAAYSQDRMHITIALATIPHLELPLTRATAKSLHFPDALARVASAQIEASAKLGEIVTRIAAASLDDPG